MNLQSTCKDSLWSSSAQRFYVALTIVCVMFAATAASAACGSGGGSRPSQAVSLPTLAGLLAAPADNGNPGKGESIVGLWHVTYTLPDGTFYYESYDTWHSDGTEWESANLSPLIGNICEGVWKQAGAAVHLHHVVWNFDNGGNPIGPGTMTENLVVGGNGNVYQGTFDYKQYDFNGNLTVEVMGMVAATRITVN